MINLDAKSSRPWVRDDFQHQDFEEWVTGNRGEFVWAILILARAWIISGRQPFREISLGGFSDWAKTGGGILTNAGISGFIGNTEELYEFSSEEDLEWESFLLDLHDRYCGRGVRIRDLSDDLQSDLRLAALIPITIDNPFNQSGELKPTSHVDSVRYLVVRSELDMVDQMCISRERILTSHNKVATWRFVRGDCGVCGDDLP